MGLPYHRLVIGVGIHSVQGALIEQALLEKLSPDEFCVHPFVEPEYESLTFPEIQQRSVTFANRLKDHYEAKTYIGIASGIAPWEHRVQRNPIRHDVATNLQTNGYGHTLVWPLNSVDRSWQLKNKICGLASVEESIKNLLVLIRQWCGTEFLRN